MVTVARTAFKRARWITASLLLCLTTCAPLFALWHNERHEQRNELYQMEEKWRDATLRGNATAMSALLADDYMAITSNGMLQSKEQTLAHLRNGIMRFRAIAVSDRKVRFYGTTAVVTCRAEVAGTTAEGDITGSYRYTHVWVQNETGGWRIVSFEASRIRNPQGHK